MKGKLIAVALGMVAILGGLVAVEATGLAPEDVAAHETTTQDYKLTINAEKPLEFASQTTETAVPTKPADEELYITAPDIPEDATGGEIPTTYTTANAIAKTELGTEIDFGTTNAKASEGYALNFTEYAQYYAAVGEIHNIDPINGIKSIKVTFDTTGGNEAPWYVHLVYSYTKPCAYTSRFDQLMDDDAFEYDERSFSTPGGVFEYDFQDDIAPCYFALEVDRGNGSSSGSNQNVTSIEITYSCEPVREDVSEVTVNSKLQLNQASLYYRSKATSVSGTITLGSDIELTREMRWRNLSNSSKFTLNGTLDLGGYTLKAIYGERFYTSGMRWEQGLIAVYGSASLTIKGEGSLEAGDIDTNLVTTGSGRYTQNSTINIEGGTYKSTAARSAIFMQASSTYDYAGTLNVSGGTFQNADGTANTRLIGVGKKSDGTTLQTAYISITGGTFVGFDPKDYVDATFYDVTESVYSGDVKQYAVSIKSEVTLAQDVTLKSALKPTSAMTVNGGGYTITLDASFTGEIIDTDSPITVKNVIIDYGTTKASGHGIFATSDATIENVTINNFDANGQRLYAINLYGGGDATLTNVTVTGANHADLYYAADIWIGDGRDVTISGGSIGSVFVNASEGAGFLRAGEVFLANNPSIGKLTLEWEKNNNYAITSGGKTYEPGTAYMKATWSGTKAEATTIVDNPQKFDVSGLTNLTASDFVINVASAAEFNAAAAELATFGGTINVTADFTMDAKLSVAGSDITVNGNGHTITYPADDSALGTGPAFYHKSSGSLHINDLNFDFASITDCHGIRTEGDMHLNNVDVLNFGATALNGYWSAVQYYGSGVTTGSITDCTIDSNVDSYDQWYYAELWIGASRNITIKGGSYGKVYVNAYDTGTTRFNTSTVTVEGGATVDNFTIGNNVAHKADYTGTKPGETSASTFSRDASGNTVLFYTSYLKVADGCTVNVNGNPNNFTDVEVKQTAADGYTTYTPSAKGNTMWNVTDITDLAVSA